MRGHVHHVTGVRDKRAQPVGGGDGLLWMRGGFDGVNIEMIGAGMVGVEAQDEFERFDNLRRPRLRRSIFPQIPRVQVHGRLDHQRAHISVCGVGTPECAHGLRVGGIQGTAVVGLRVGVTPAERGDEVLLERRSARRARLRASQGVPGSGGLVRRHKREIDVRAVDERDAPPGHGAVRIERGGVPELLFRGVMLEANRRASSRDQRRSGPQGRRW